MADNPKGLGDALASLGTAITSPAKLAYVGYLALVFSDKIKDVSACSFVLVTIAFIVIQIFHDDYLRIKLNDQAKLDGVVKRRKEGFGPDWNRLDDSPT